MTDYDDALNKARELGGVPYRCPSIAGSIILIAFPDVRTALNMCEVVESLSPSDWVIFKPIAQKVLDVAGDAEEIK